MSRLARFVGPITACLVLGACATNAAKKPAELTVPLGDVVAQGNGAHKAAAAAAAVSPLAVVNWVPMHTGQPLPGGALVGGRDYDSDNVTLYVCRASIFGGVHPGKFLSNNCNVSFGGSGTEYHDFEVAVISNGTGHWGPYDATQVANMLLGGHEATGAPLYVCHVNYIHKDTLLGPFFPSDHDSGVHPGKLVNGKCDIEWGGKEIPETQYLQMFYLTPPPPPPPVHASKPAPGPKCGQAGQPDCPSTCSLPPRDYYCGLLAQPWPFLGCRATGVNPTCQDAICTDDKFTAPLCY